MQSKVLVTGGAGRLGKLVIAELIKRDCKVSILDNFAETGPADLLQFMKIPDFSVCMGDIRDTHVCRKAVQGIDTVIHLANVDRAAGEENPVLPYAVNVLGMEKLMKSAQEAGVKRFVFLSREPLASGSTYNSGGDPPDRDQDSASICLLEPGCIGEYSRRLVTGSRVFELVGLRFFDLFAGPDSPEYPYANVCSGLLRKLGETRPIMNYRDGSPITDESRFRKAARNLVVFGLDLKETVPNTYLGTWRGGTLPDTPTNTLFSQFLHPLPDHTLQSPSQAVISSMVYRNNLSQPVYPPDRPTAQAGELTCSLSLLLSNLSGRV